MHVPTPDRLLFPLAERIPHSVRRLIPALTALALILAAVAIAFHQAWLGAGLLLLGLTGAALRRADPLFPLALLAVPFAFGLAMPERALAAMFLTLALAVVTIVLKGGVSIVHWLAGLAFLAACILPNYFSPLVYVVGIACFVAAGQGLAKARP